MNKMWIDLTDFTIWHGVHTGTQRVVYQITSRLKNASDVRFCSYDYINKQYREVSYDEVFGVDSNNSGSTANQKVKLKAPAKALRRAYGLFMPPIATKTANQIKNKRNQEPSSGFSISINADFKNNDMLVVLGGNWDKPGFIDALELVKNSGVKLVHNINDLIPIFDRGHVSSDEHVRYEKYMKRVIQNADLLTAISEHTKKDIQRYCSEQTIKCPPIYVMRLGDNPISAVPKTVAGLPEKFILSVSTIELRKNHMLLYYVYKEAISRNIELPTLVLAGKRGWLTGDLQFMLAHDTEVKDKIIIVEAPADNELAWLYNECLFTIYPSYYEGWGLPVAESIMYGKFCLATNTTSVPEVAGEVLDYFSPFNSEDCLNGVIKLLDDTYRDKRQANMKKAYKKTTWEDTTNKLLKKLNTI